MSYRSVWLAWLVVTILGFVLTGPFGFAIGLAAFIVALALSVLIEQFRWDLPKKQRPRTYTPNYHHSLAKRPRQRDPMEDFIPMPPDVGQTQAEKEAAILQALAKRRIKRGTK